MKTLIVAAIISVATADITTSTISTIKDTNNSESTYVKNFTASTIKVSILTTENPEWDNTTESTNVVLSRKNGTITRQGKLTEGQNTSKSNIQYRNHQDSDENKYIDKDGNKVLQIEFITKPETHRSILKNIFQKILSYKNIHLEKTDNNEKEKLIKAYILLVSQKYKRKWVPKNIGLKLLPVKNVTLKGRSTNKRQKRSIKEDAGFTHDAETCKQYNNNLITLWSNLSKYIGTSEKSPPNKSVLHNIGIMIKAYLDHVTPSEMNTETATEKLIVRKERNISSILYPIVKEIKNKIDLNKVNENTLTAFILEQVKHFRIDNINEECNKVIHNQITTLINIAFKKYLIYANCNLYKSPYNGNNILNNMPLNNQNIYSKLQPSNVPRIDEPRYHRNLLKIVKRSPTETTNIIDSNTQIASTVKDSAVSSNFNNLTKNEIINGSNTIQSRRAIQLNGKYCADLALDQFILTVKLILRLYLLNDDCTQGANKFIIISKLIEATPILEPFNENNLNYLSQYHVLLQLLDNMENEEMSNLFNIPEAEVLQNKNILEDFLHDINNLALISYKRGEKSNIADHRNDLKQIPNSLYNYQQLYNRLLNANNAGIINAGFKAILPTNEDKKINENFKELQVMYTGVPINQHFVANQSVIYEKLTNNRTYTKPITIGVNLNSGSYLNNPSVNNLNNFLSATDSKTLTIPSNTYSVHEKDNFNVNPMHYNLIMNYSETYPTSVKGNSFVSGLPPFPYLNPFNNSLTDINPFKNTLLYQHLASNPGTLSNYISKFTKINSNKENQFNNSPPVPNNGVLMNLLTNNNRAMINNNFNTKSELNVNEANVKNSLRNPFIALDQNNLNIPSNFAINSGVNYNNQFNNGLTNMNSNLIKNNNLNLFRDNLVREQSSLNPFNVKHINALHVMKPNVVRSNLNLDNNQNVVHSTNIGSNFVLRNAYPLRPQIQNNPIISRTDFTPNSSISSFINNKSLKVSNSSYITSQAIRTMSGVPLKNIQYNKKPEYPLKSLFINPYSYSAKLINKENEFDKFLNLENTPILRSNFLRTHEKKLETKTLPIVSIDNLPTISSDPDANGDVELTYVFHYPQIVVYQPQVLVKRRISYVDYINNFNNIFNNQKKNQQQLHLYKIIRYLPHNNVQVLYQSDGLIPILKIENSTSSN